MKNKIKEWLASGKDYSKGVSLYASFGPSQNMARILSRSEASDYTRETLEYELGKLLDTPDEAKPSSKRPLPGPAAQIVPVAPQQQATAVHPDPVKGWKKDELYRQIINKIKVRDVLHSTLALVGDSVRKQNALEILDVSDFITDGYLRLDHYEKTGELPPAKSTTNHTSLVPVDQLDKSQLVNQRNNARSHISRYKALIRDPDKSSQVTKYILALSQWEERLKSIETFTKT